MVGHLFEEYKRRGLDVSKRNVKVLRGEKELECEVSVGGGGVI